MLTKTIALFSANPAFGALVGSSLQSEARLKVYPLQTLDAVTTLLRIAPVDMVLVDCDGSLAEIAATVVTLRDLPKRAQEDLSIMLLTRAEPGLHAGLRATGVDVVHAKPVSPERLLESVRTQLHIRAAGPIVDGRYRGPERRRVRGASVAPVAVRQDNVVELFGRIGKTA